VTSVRRYATLAIMPVPLRRPSMPLLAVAAPVAAGPAAAAPPFPTISPVIVATSFPGMERSWQDRTARRHRAAHGTPTDPDPGA
jgi:hypothetical protein